MTFSTSASPHKRLVELQCTGSEILLSRAVEPAKPLTFMELRDKGMRRLFDEACDLIHYAGSCRRVGRCMRLALVVDGLWAGGTVLGSPFPNIGARDEAFGLTQYTRGFQQRGLISPWASENRAYWDRLQLIVNHARTFIFPQFHGRGLGVGALSLLPTRGKEMWEARYGEGVLGFDTHCTSSTSRLFIDNGWELVGQTKGFSRDRRVTFSGRVEDNRVAVKDNAGLTKRRKNPRWWTWVLRLNSK